MELTNVLDGGKDFGIEYELNPEQREDVRERYPKCYFPDPVMQPLWYGRLSKTRVDGRKAIVDQKTGEVFGIASEAYKIIFYEDIVHLVEQSIGNVKDYGEIKLHPMTYMDGARFRLSISFPEAKTRIKIGEDVIPKIQLYSSLDTIVKLKGKIGLWMLKCSNGMGTWKSSVTFAKRHLQTLFLNDLGESISVGVETFQDQVDNWRKWTELPIAEDTYEMIWEALPFSKAERTRIEALPETGTGLLLPNAIGQKSLDLWSFNSVVTQFATHEVKSEVRRVNLETDVAKVMEQYSNIIQRRMEVH